MADTPEGKLKKKVRALLDAHGIWHYVATQGPYSVHGIPDIMGCWDGRLLAIECKAPGKRKNTTVAQARKLAEIASAGGIALVCDDPLQLKEILNAGPQQTAGCHIAAAEPGESAGGHQDRTTAECRGPVRRRRSPPA